MKGTRDQPIHGDMERRKVWSSEGRSLGDGWLDVKKQNFPSQVAVLAGGTVEPRANDKLLTEFGINEWLYEVFYFQDFLSGFLN